MKKMTLLEMVQNIASALETDEVNSITDTTESLQIAEVIKETFYELFNNIFIPEFQGMFTLMSYSNPASPNYLVAPEDVSKINWIKYKNARINNVFQPVDYMNPEEFLNMMLAIPDDSDRTITTQDPTSGVQYNIYTNKSPSFFTMFDDRHIAFDSIDLETESTLQDVNSVAYGWKDFDFLMEDSFVPPIDGNLFPLLLAEAKSVCFINLKQITSSKEEQRARRQRIRLQNDKFKSEKAQREYWNRGPDFSRRR